MLKALEVYQETLELLEKTYYKLISSNVRNGGESIQKRDNFLIFFYVLNDTIDERILSDNSTEYFNSYSRAEKRQE